MLCLLFIIIIYLFTAFFLGCLSAVQRHHGQRGCVKLLSFVSKGFLLVYLYISPTLHLFRCYLANAWSFDEKRVFFLPLTQRKKRINGEEHKKNKQIVSLKNLKWSVKTSSHLVVRHQVKQINLFYAAVLQEGFEMHLTVTPPKKARGVWFYCTLSGNV